jgi:hypothetical protein
MKLPTQRLSTRQYFVLPPFPARQAFSLRRIDSLLNPVVPVVTSKLALPHSLTAAYTYAQASPGELCQKRPPCLLKYAPTCEPPTRLYRRACTVLLGYFGEVAHVVEVPHKLQSPRLSGWCRPHTGFGAATRLRSSVVCAIGRNPTSNRNCVFRRERSYHRRFVPGQY